MLKIAWRNLWRNKTRTIIVITAISLSYALALVSLAMMDSMYPKMMELALNSAGGSVLVHGDGYWASQSADAYIEDPEAVFTATEGVDGIEVVIPRVIINGLLRTARDTAPARISGIDPELEANLLDYREFLVEGDFLESTQRNPIVMGRGLVDDLEMEMGDHVILRAPNPEGDPAGDRFYLTGIIETGSGDVDDFLAFTTIDAAQQATDMGGGLTQIGLVISDDADRIPIRDQIALALGDAAPSLELLTWDEAMPEVLSYIEIDSGFGYIYFGIVLIVVAFGIANTFLMSYMERIRELGLLSAIGLTPGRTARLLLAEAFWLGILSIVVGFAIGFGMHSYLHVYGLDLREMYGSDLEIGGVMMSNAIIYTQLRPLKWLAATGIILFLVILSSMYPAFKAIRLNPAQAMRTYD